MIAKIVQTAKHNVKATVDSPKALVWSCLDTSGLIVVTFPSAWPAANAGKVVREEQKQRRAAERLIHVKNPGSQTEISQI